MKRINFNQKWLSNGIGEEYKSWETNDPNNATDTSHIFIESPTGTGKTSFILNKLLPYAAKKQRHILYLCNRTALEKQMKNAVAKKLLPARNDIPCTDNNAFFFPERKASITILNYQSLLRSIKLNQQNGYFFNPFYYVILDEAHFFLEDALFNSLTGIIYDKIMTHFSRAVLIFMSATIIEFEGIYDLTKKDSSNYYFSPNLNITTTKYHNSFTNTRYQPYTYQTDNEVISKIKTCPDNEKWLIFVSSKKAGENLKTKIRESTGKTVAFLDSSKKKTITWERIVKDSHFAENILISTKVLDNGVNITDPSVKHIVLPFCCKTDFLQMLGRKRFTEKNEMVNVYIKSPTIQALNAQLKQLIYLDKTMNIFIQKQHNPEFMLNQLRKLWTNCDRSTNSLFYINNSKNLVINVPACLKIGLMRNFYQALKENYYKADFFLNIIKDWLGESSKPVLSPITMPNCNSLDDFIKLYLDKTITDDDIEDIYNGFQQLYKMHCTVSITDSEKLKKALSIRKGKDRRIPTINNELKFLNFPYKITKKQGCLALRRFAE